MKNTHCLTDPGNREFDAVFCGEIDYVYTAAQF